MPLSQNLLFRENINTAIISSVLPSKTMNVHKIILLGLLGISKKTGVFTHPWTALWTDAVRYEKTVHMSILPKSGTAQLQLVLLQTEKGSQTGLTLKCTEQCLLWI